MYEVKDMNYFLKLLVLTAYFLTGCVCAQDTQGRIILSVIFLEL